MSSSGATCRASAAAVARWPRTTSRNTAVVDAEPGIADQTAGRPRMSRDEPQRQLPLQGFGSGPPHGLQAALRTVHTGDDRRLGLVLSHPVPPTRHLTATMPPFLRPRQRLRP